ncbi:MAG: transposase [Acidiferrobacteraceae bacterium]
MSYSYAACDRDQLFLLPPSMWDWLPEGHLALFLIDAVELIDTTAFDEAHPNEGAGRPAYDPDMMLVLLFYSYCLGMRSSRQIARSCRSDVAFRVICAGNQPDHTTICRFRADNEEPIVAVFVEVLRLCAAAGLASLGRIAIDGTKIGSDAALDANRDGEAIRAEIAKILAEAGAADAAEEADMPPFDDMVGPEPLKKRNSRLAHLRAARAEVEAQERAAREKKADSVAKAEAEAAQGRKLRGRKPSDPHAAAERARLDLAAVQARAARQPERAALAAELAAAGARATEAAAAAEAAPARSVTVNVTDPDSRIMKTQAGWVQGYNVQAAVNADQVVIACAATQDHNDSDQLISMMTAAETTAWAAGITEAIGVVLADAGYWSDDNATADGPDRLIATTKDWKQRRAARELGTTTGPPPQDATTLEAMEHRLRTPEGAAAYATRSHTVEPVFGDTKENRGFRRFMRHGLAAANSEAHLIFSCHNLKKIFDHNPAAIYQTA